MVALSGTRYRNFDALRLIAAASVIFSHAFAVTEGSEDNEWLVRLLGPGNLAGVYGVFTFFIISGFLVTRSYHQSRDLSAYLAKRSLRIFPGVFVCACMMSFVLVPAFTTLPLGDYLLTRPPYTYVVKTTLLLDTTRYFLFPGFQFSDLRYGLIVNGSLWSLGPEFLCYLGVVALAFVGLARPAGAALALVLGLWAKQAGLLGNFGFTAAYFAAGMLIYHALPRIAGRRWIDALALAVLVAGAASGYPATAFALGGSWLVIRLGMTERINLGRATRFGDLSYGTYLYGWPIEQCVVKVMGASAAWYWTFLIALPLSLCAAWLSWHLVEKRALRRVPALAEAMRRRLERSPVS